MNEEIICKIYFFMKCVEVFFRFIGQVPVELRLRVGLLGRACNEGYPKVRKDFTSTEKGSTRAFCIMTLLPNDLCVLIPFHIY